MYLLPTSCHPASVTKNIPFSLCLRIVRICSKTEYRDKQFLKLKELMLSRGYSDRMIDSAIERARTIPRHVALRKVFKKDKDKRPIFVTTYDPRLPNIQNIQAKHWRSMTCQDPYLKEVFKAPPLTAFKRQKNIRDHIIRAKLPNSQRAYPLRNLKGMKKCKKFCRACPFIIETKCINIDRENSWNIEQNLDCNTSNVVYMIECNKENCKMRYIGETKRIFKFRMAEHIGYVQNQDDTPSGRHFNESGHSLADMKMFILEKVKKNDELYRKEREHYFIRKFNTYYKGLNRQP